MELQNLVCAVTGAGQGIGQAVAEKFFAEGACVSLWDMDGALARKTALSIDPSGERTMAVQMNVIDETESVEAVRKTIEKFNRIDVLVNVAGISRHKTLEEMTVELWDEVIDTNLKGVFLCCKAVAPIMKEQKRGKIVNIASLGGRTGRPGVGVNYAASKAGVVGITQLLAKELGPAGIYVNAIAPGPILTEQTRQYPPEVFATWNTGRAIPKDGLPEDVADTAVFLSSRRSDWVTGVTLDLNGGILIR
ncbi:MAG: SDR family oxidoreductase [Deltaproteobacteria bacterium]|nr:SDR family oxidoreductase [Deltaproteobacteria bacterium]